MITQNNNLISQLQDNYKKYKGIYKNINICGILDESNQNKDIFNDKLILNIGNELWYWTCTCNPGKHCTETKQGGSAHLIYGYQDNIWTLAEHAASNASFHHMALCNRQEFNCKPTTIWRDINKDYIQEKNDPVQTGYFGINCHRASVQTSVQQIGNYSEGCVVTQDHKDFEWFISKLQKQKEILSSKHYLFGFLLTSIKDWNLTI